MVTKRLTNKKTFNNKFGIVMCCIKTSRLILIVIFISFVNLNFSLAQSNLSNDIDKLVNYSMTTFDVPGIAVAVVKDGQVIHSKGYGVRSLNSKLPIDENTLFGIASNSKAFTTATLAILFDEGKINWDDRVIDYIPEFRLYSPYVTEDFRIRDLLTHRSGLGLGAGDLMFFPDSTNFTINDLIHNLRFLKQRSPFRSKFDYDNLLYMVAGEIVKRVSGMSWEEFVEKRIMTPLNMRNSAANFDRLKDKSNVIDGHAPVNGKVQVIKRHNFMVGENPAGGIYSSIADLSKWVIAQINEGRYGKNLNKKLFSKKAHDEMWTSQTILPIKEDSIYHTHFRTYGLGWFMSDVNGYKEVSHTGGLEGMVTQVVILPEISLGIIVLTNQQSGAAFRSISNTIKDRYIGLSEIDWVKRYKTLNDKKQKKAKKITDKIWNDINQKLKVKSNNIQLEKFAGNYADKWFGTITISQKGKHLWFQSHRSPKLNGKMLYYKNNTFVVKWADRSFNADAFVMFTLNMDGIPDKIKMKAISPLTDFSYDFQDLDFEKISIN